MLWRLCCKFCVFRLGGESLAVAQNTYAVSWFMGRELNMVFGLQLSFSRVVSVLPALANIILLPRETELALSYFTICFSGQHSEFLEYGKDV